MTKNNKILFWVGMGLFIIPELLWSPVLNYLYELLQIGSGEISSLRMNFLLNNQNYGFFWYGFIVALQLLGLLIMIKTLRQSSINGRVKLLLASVLWGLVVISVVILYFILSFDINI